MLKQLIIYQNKNCYKGKNTIKNIKMPNYQLSKIYKLICNDPDLIYYGSTTQKYLCSRLGQHKKSYKNGINITSKYLFYKGEVSIILIEDFPCDNINQLNAREAEFIRNNKCVNKNILGKTIKEYRNDNKEQILENKKEKITCECGSLISKINLSNHKKTKKHLINHLINDIKTKD